MGLHGGIYRSCCEGCTYHGHPDCLHGYIAPPEPSDFYLPSPENRELKGFLYDLLSERLDPPLCTVTVASAPFQLNLFVHSVTGLITTILVFRIHAGMQVPCCSQRSSPGCSLTLAVRPPSQALHTGSPLPTTTNSLLTQQPDHRLTERMGATGSYLLNRALAAAEQHADRSQVNAAKFLSARYYFFERSGKTLHKCLAYTSASQTSTAVVAALGDFTETHYWMCVQS